jgi:hypothetical protein
MLAKLGDFGCDYMLAISLLGIAREIFLMVGLCDIERRRRHDFSHYRVAIQGGACDFVDHALSDGLLLRRVVENRGAILCADVVAKTLSGRGLEDRPEP